MKAAELPINVIVIVVLCLIVLLAILALFTGVWRPSSSSLNLETAKNNACQMLISTNGCNVPESTKTIVIKDFDANKDEKIGEENSNTNGCGSDVTGDNLFMLCKCWYSITGANDAEIDYNCKTRVCNCD
ncbi:MAG: hypothetical protein QW076_05340 [Candidatus Anstonellales archaeon]